MNKNRRNEDRAIQGFPLFPQKREEEKMRMQLENPPLLVTRDVGVDNNSVLL